MAKKKARKTSEKSSEPKTKPPMVEQPHGGALQVGNPGNKGGGRPRDEFRAKMRELASSEETLSVLTEMLTRPTDPKKSIDPQTFLKAFKEAADRGYGKAIQPVEHAGPDGGPIPIGDAASLREFLARELAGMRERSDTTPDPGEAHG